MTDQWELCKIVTNIDRVCFFTPETWEINYGVREFISKHYPDIQLPQKGDAYPYLVDHLLKDGWEPFSATYNETWENLYFRRKVE